MKVSVESYRAAMGEAIAEANAAGIRAGWDVRLRNGLMRRGLAILPATIAAADVAMLHFVTADAYPDGAPLEAPPPTDDGAPLPWPAGAVVAWRREELRRAMIEGTLRRAP